MSDSRTRRLHVLAELLRSGTMTSQEDATAQLKAAGFAVTQATVSRDLDHLGAVKVKRGGILSYALPDQIGVADWSTDRLERLMREWVIGVEAAGPLIVIRTPPGSAHLVGAALDQAQLPEIAGTVSGDDTLFAALRDGTDSRSVLDRFREMAGESRLRIA